MNLSLRRIREATSKIILTAVFISILPVISGTTTTRASAANLATNEAATTCASLVSDSATAKLDVRIDGNYCVLSFLSGTNTFLPSSGLVQIEYLVIGGGGGGGGGRGGGGGAGGFLSGSFSTTSQLSITVGNGGAGAVNSTNGSNGETSTISFSTTSINAVGGGGGGASFSAATNYPARSGASGGGAGIYASGLTANTDGGTPGGLGISGQGNNGGSSGGKSPNDGTDSSYSYKGTCTQNWDQIRNTAGGGGAGGKGIAGRGGSAPQKSPANLDSCQAPVAPDGGAGRSSNILGAPRFYAAGGGGAAGRFDKTSENVNYYTAPPGVGGSGIGGAGSAIAGTNGGAGLPNTGSGGGGGGVSRTNDTEKGACASGSDLDESCDGGSGGSGIVIIRFQKHFDNSVECISGVSDTSSTVLEYNTYAGDCILKFSTPNSTTAGTNSWTPPAGLRSAWIVVVGAGGGGGSNEGGGGGGGQVQESKTAIVSSGLTLSIRVGKGGTNTGDALTRRFNGGYTGESTTVSGLNFKLNSLGGGGASAVDNPVTDGWTGGGCATSTSVCSAPANAPVGGSSFRGGNGYGNTNANAGGGGGAGGVGEAGGNGNGGSGGIGVTTTITGVAQCFGGGGGGGAWSSALYAGQYVPGSGSCGGANGTATRSGNSDATSDTGGGGGGGGGGNNSDTFAQTANGGRGGTGLVIIRFTLPTSNAATQSLNMACHAFPTATDPTAAESAGYFGKPFPSDTATTEFTFPYAEDSAVRHDWSGVGPNGCSNSNDYFTLYLWGYIKAPSSSDTSTVWFATRSDDGAILNVDGQNLIKDTRVRGFDVGIDTATTSITMSPNSWHFIQFWLHENTGAAAIELYWQTNSVAQANSWTLVPKTFVSRTVPRTMNVTFPGTSSDLVSTSIKATIDTSTVVYGGPNDSSTAKSLGGTFKFTESGTAISGCESVASVNGFGQCDLGSLPSAGTVKYYKIYFTPTDSLLSTDLQTNVFSNTTWTQNLLMGKLKNATLRIGQYIAFSGISSYPLNVYADSQIYGAVTRSLVDSGTANCELDASKFLLTANKIGSCTVSANAAGDANHYSETTTATIYWIQWSDAYATRVASTPTEIVLQHQTQIIRHAYETLTVTSYTDTATVPNTITSARPGQTIRILGTGFVATDTSSQATFTDNEYADRTDLTNDYIQVVVPDGAVTGPITVDTLKGTALGPTLTITSP